MWQQISVILFALIISSCQAAIQEIPEQVTVTNDTCRVAFSKINGAILGVWQSGKTVSIWQSGEYGLWSARFRNGKTVSASEFDGSKPDYIFKYTRDTDNRLVFQYQCPLLSVDVTVTSRLDGISMQAKITPSEDTVLDFALPARLRFNPDIVQQFISPMNGNNSVGAAFNVNFFKAQPQDKPSGWSNVISGPMGYEALFGGGLNQRADLDPTVPLKITEDGEKWLGGDLAGRINSGTAVVNRPSTYEQSDMVLIDSENGPWFSASQLQGTGGYLWRLGGAIGDNEANLATDAVAAVIQKLAQEHGTERNQICLVSLSQGPEVGSWVNIRIAEWAKRLREISRLTGMEYVETHSPDEMFQAIHNEKTLLILNPYGEAVPVGEGGIREVTDAVRDFMHGGGNWFELGGYSFFYTLKPLLYLNIDMPYPVAFADFQHLETNAGSASVYRVQPRTWEPWAGAENPETIFIPGNLGCGGDDRGGYCDRRYGTFVEPGNVWTCPESRITVGYGAFESIKNYKIANQLIRRLTDKMSPEKLDAFRNSVLVYYAGNARDKLKNLNLLPVPTQVHFADYLKGGFDKEYPDHLPPSPYFGTPEEMRQLFAEVTAQGHLVMPYTNPTWWCDHPRGPTFGQYSEEPLLKGLNGNPTYERYANNDGWTVCHWHPAVQAANRKTVRQFTDEYPVGMLFQDQNGARSWQYDLNPASPTPYAYTEGLLSQVMEDSRIQPLSTEAGWDQVANYESQLCGMSWQIVPTENGPSWRQYLKEIYPPNTWEVFPLAQAIAHDKTAMLHHDLGQFVTNQEVLSWTLGLGFSLSYTVSANSLQTTAPRQWLLWLDRLQKSVCAKYVGEGVTAFKHNRGPTPTMTDDGIIKATYGQVSIIANLSSEPKTIDGYDLAGFGFIAKAPGMVAGIFKSIGGQEYGNEGISYVAEQTASDDKVWVYAPDRTDVTVEMPDGNIKTVKTGNVDVKLRIEPPVELQGKALHEITNIQPAIGVLDLGDEFGYSWTKANSAQWQDYLEHSDLHTVYNLQINRITTAQELKAALQAGVKEYLAILNPYGEGFPVDGPGTWQEMLGEVKNYVENGGSWWEMGGYSLYSPRWQEDGKWVGEVISSSGMGFLGLPVGGGEVTQAAETLVATPDGKRWLGENLVKQISQSSGIVNRGLPVIAEDPGHTTLVAGENGQHYIGGYRLNGWGWFWRLGGFYPDPQIVMPVVAGAIEHIYTTPPEPVPVSSIKYVWEIKN